MSNLPSLIPFFAQFQLHTSHHPKNRLRGGVAGIACCLERSVLPLLTRLFCARSTVRVGAECLRLGFGGIIPHRAAPTRDVFCKQEAVA